MREVTVAATQMIGGWNVEENIARGDKLVREAASQEIGRASCRERV